MSRVSNIHKLSAFRRVEKLKAKARHALHQEKHPRPVAKSDDNITPKREAARSKRGENS